MGEKIRTLATIELFNSKFEIELNKPTAANKEAQIHFQSDKFRIELDKTDFIKYGLLILSAEKNLKQLKNIK